MLDRLFVPMLRLRLGIHQNQHTCTNNTQITRAKEHTHNGNISPRKIRSNVSAQHTTLPQYANVFIVKKVWTINFYAGLSFKYLVTTVRCFT